MKKLIIILSLILVLTLHINIYAETSISTTDTVISDVDIKTQEEIIASILADNDFNEYLRSNGITQEELKEVLYSDYFANYVEFELKQIPEDNEVVASWNVLEWHIQKLENFINYIFNGNKDYHANNNNNNYDNYRHHRHNNNYNNMMPPPPPPPNTNWNNGWGQYPPNNWNNGYNNNNGIINNSNNNCSGNICNCDCDNCKNCLNK